MTGAGTAEITNQLEYDDEVAFQATAQLRDLSRAQGPAALVPDGRASPIRTTPTSPAAVLGPLRGLPGARPGGGGDALRGAGPAFAPADARLRPHRLRDHARGRAPARRGYFANISYVDEKIGEILGVLERSGMAEDTVVVFISDHGDMLGERGLWFKMSFREGSARVPLMIAAPGMPRGPASTRRSPTLDIVPTLGGARRLDLGDRAGDRRREPRPGRARRRVRGPVPMEYAAEGSVAPMVALRDGR